ncbi:cell division protein FtsQ/DivIB [Inediibacterium massiliense]|uniref:cell division protein FtsQ/DivIB n=1 Tax=Inediibacterium massiliense TaxID=1658111 RepID=UPI0006B4B91A|nr:FtsQ-type POTRA domain-containing protein [Inediibacterium massiliense]
MKKFMLEEKVHRSNKKLFSLILLLIGIVAFIVIFKTDVFTIKNVEVIGNKQISENAIISKSAITIGNHILKEKLENAKINLYKDPYIKTVEIERKFPNKIVIHITERKEEALIQFMNEYLIIDEDGMVLRSSSQMENLKVIKGLAFSNFMAGSILKVKDKSQFKQALEIVRGLNRHKVMIQELDISNKKDIKIKITNDLICKIGKGNDLDYRLEALNEILKDLSKRQITRGVVDISHEGYPTYRPVE